LQRFLESLASLTPSKTEEKPRKDNHELMGCGASSKKYEKKTDDEEEDDDDDQEAEMDEEEFEKQVARTTACRKTRAAVAAESVQKSDDWKPPVHQKNDDQKARLQASLAKSFMFAALEEEALATVIMAFQENHVEAATTVIEQGKEVNATEPALYVIESGKLSVFKNGIEASVFTYTNPGQYFGDLAVLYNAPRAATVVADEKSVLWSIDRNTFNFCVKDAAREAMQRRLDFLNSVPLLNGLTADEKATICEALQVRTVEKNKQIIKEGEESSDFYIIESGKCVAKKGDRVVFEYEAKNYFGELALLKSAPRAADVFAVENTKLLMLGAETFKRMFGPLEDLLRERLGSYEGINIEELTKQGKS